MGLAAIPRPRLRHGLMEPPPAPSWLVGLVSNCLISQTAVRPPCRMSRSGNVSTPIVGMSGSRGSCC